MVRMPRAIAVRPALPAAVAALRTARWTGCEDGEHTVSVEFLVSDPCIPKALAVERIGGTQFRVSVSEPPPCIYAMVEQTVRRFWFFKKRISKCWEICEPCPPGDSRR